ncbi:MAG TPA: histidine kinase dimerization/phospho-acceptor domain-containing protein, partial [Flavobacteriales bacterium]|nr:histidine kinase dimerization/phospho-acceptor domain-containing protein [Flavobacteriales bacterium]
MDKRWITGLMAAISIALIGLVVIQVFWIRNTITLKETQFTQSVGNALYAVSDRLEQVEKMGDLKRHRAGRRLLRKLDAMRRASAPPGTRGSVVDAPLVMDRDSGGVSEPPIPPMPPEAAITPTDSDEALPPAWNPRELEDHEALVTDMVRSILSQELARDIHDRVDPTLLDSLMTAELAANGIPTNVEYGIFSEDGEPIDPEDKNDGMGNALGESPLRERLYRHDLAGEPYYLHVVVPGQQGMLLRGLVPMLLVSALFVGIIVMGFVYTIRTIVRQKRISDIRNDLVNNLTHELKTPISTIGLACEALADPSMPKTEQQVKTFTSMIRDENKRLGSLVENVLQSAVLDSGHMVLKRVELDLHSLLQDVVRSSNIQVSRRNGRIELDLRAEIHHLQGDRIHLTNVLYNLIDNAVKYTEQEPRVRIATR